MAHSFQLRLRGEDKQMKDWGDFKREHGLHDFTDPIEHMKAVLTTMKPKHKVKYLKELLAVTFQKEMSR